MSPLIEQFITSLYFWLFVFLIIGVVFSSVVVANKRHAEEIFGKPSKRKSGKRITRQRSNSELSQKLGEKVVRYMIEVAHSVSRPALKDRIARIKKECESLMLKPLPEENKKIISTVLLWSKRFNIDKHITDLTVYHHSGQITYDDKRRDFKLKIIGQ